ncbi:GNAT family N-acetyltransferase [Albidovulum sp.]|jgi:predicted N-acetyltransferase YhbS|uniref:GNAT family N-acetyltransferase n=1 Tax=Albidovulum sp. TaxID=1872424 RepID=UPI0039B9B7D5
MFTLRPERPDDGPAIEALLDTAFGPGRFAKTAYRLREGVAPVDGLSFVAEEDGALIGSIRYWPVSIGGRPALMLGPIAVLSSQRGRGIAVGLMQTTLEAAAKAGHRAVVLVGDEPYYARVGFSRVPMGRMTMPGPVDYRRLLWRELGPGGLEALQGLIGKAA